MTESCVLVSPSKSSVPVHLLDDEVLAHIIPEYLSPYAARDMIALCRAYFDLCYDMQMGYFQPKFPTFRELRRQHAIRNAAEILREQEAMLLGSEPIERFDSLHQPLSQEEARTATLRDFARPIIAAIDDCLQAVCQQSLPKAS